MAKKIIPVFLVTGFFGSGKTTFINHVLSRLDHDNKVAVMVNDFGDVNVDSELIKQEHQGHRELAVHEISGGSIFCSCRHWEFVGGLHALARHEPGLVIVEASGMADPSPMRNDIEIASSLDPAHAYVHAGTVCIVDATSFIEQLDMFPVASRQVKQATHVVVNKIDLLAGDAGTRKDLVISVIKEINTRAAIEPATLAAISTNMFLFDVASSIDNGKADRSLNEPGNQPGKLVLETTGKTTRDDVEAFYQSVKPGLLRFKGFCLLENGWHYVDAIGDQVRFSPFPVPREKTEIVCIFPRADKDMLARLNALWHQGLARQGKDP